MAPTDLPGNMRLDDLARAAGIATTTVRLYQNRGLLPGPRLVGRTGYYDQSHLTRLSLIGRLQDQGFSLAGIGRLLETWEEGRDLTDLIGAEQLDVLVTRGHAVIMDAESLLASFPPGSLTPDLVQRAISLGVVEPNDDGRFRIPDQRFLETGSALISLGVPSDVVLDEWAHLSEVTDGVAERFIAVFEDHLLPPDWQHDLDEAKAAELAGTLTRLRTIAGRVLAAALDASIAKLGADRLAALAPDGDPAHGPSPRQTP